jgi:undecaprenyl diphosphate synthase
VAVIMDGNGRWAVEQGRSRIEGHRAGARAVREIITECGRLGLEALTLYSFSLENWKRPADEVGALMALLLEYLRRERRELIDNNVRFRQVGRRAGLPDDVLTAIDDTAAATADCTGLTLCLALNYGARAEITDAVRAIARAVRAGELDPEEIGERTIADHLYTAGLPDPDLLIRTAGEMRISNYLLWQISYAELYVTDVFWPDFRVAHLHDALREYARRSRRFGALDETVT